MAAAAVRPDYESFDEKDACKGGNRHTDFEEGHLGQQGSRWEAEKGGEGECRLGRCCSLHNSLVGLRYLRDCADQEGERERGTFDEPGGTSSVDKPTG